MSELSEDGGNGTRVAVVEESVLQRARIGQLLAQELHLDVVRTGSGMRSLVDWLRRTPQAEWPHLLVLGLPSRSDFVPFTHVVLTLRHAGIRVLAMSSPPSRLLARRLMTDGVDGLISTADTEADFLATVEEVLRGGEVITARARADVQSIARGPRLSAQEERVLVLYSSGLTIAETAESIGVRLDTARKYLTRVRDKYTAFGWPARSKLELARIAWAEGYADPEVTTNRPEPATTESTSSR